MAATSTEVVEAHLEAAMSQLNKLEKNNTHSEENIKRRAKDIEGLTGAIIQIANFAKGLEKRFQGVETNVGNIMVKVNGI